MKTIRSPLPWIAAIAVNAMIGGAAIAQSIVNVMPPANATDVSPNATITGNLQSTSTVSIPINTLKIFIDNRDVTQQSGINNAAFSYRPAQPLTAGKHNARVEFVGSDGIGRFVSWDFFVGQATQAVELTSIKHNAANGLKAGNVFQATLKGTPNQTASILLVESSQTRQAVEEVSATEFAPGEYKASFTVGRTEIKEGLVIGRLRSSNEVAYAIASQPAQFNVTTSTTPPTQTQPAKPLAVKFTSHQDGDRISSRTGFVVKGETSPNATVRVKVTSSSNDFRGILGSIISGNLLLDKTVTADKQGQFEIQVPKPLFVQKGTKYRIEAIAELNSLTSEASRIELIQD